MRTVALAGLIVIACGASLLRSQPIDPSTSTNWWWCDASQAYYPAVATCATPWTAVDAHGQPIEGSSPTAVAPNWWCDAPRGYYPSVPRCSTPWRAVGAAPANTARQGTAAPVPPAPMRPVTVSQPFVVAVETSVSGGARPTVTGTTNLPDGTQLYIWLKKPWLPNGKERLAVGLSACGDDCFPVQTNSKLPDGVGLGVVVKNGHFSDGPFTDNGAALRPGEYVLEVSSYFAATQPADVRAIIGPLGENMTGPLVGGCCFGSNMSQAEIQKELDKLRSATPTVGASFYYARYVTIGPN